MDSSQATQGSTEFVESMVPVEFVIDRELFQASYDSTRDRTSLAVVSVVATALDRDPMDLPPLYSVIDPDALEELLSGSANGLRGCDSISFRYAGFEVTVFSEGIIEAEPVEDT